MESKPTETRLAELQQTFCNQLQARIEKLREHWQAWVAGQDPHAFEGLQRQAHSLAASAGTFGAELVGLAAHALDKGLSVCWDTQQLPDREILQELEQRLVLLERTAAAWHPGQFMGQETNSVRIRSMVDWNNLVYLVEDDPLLAAKLLEVVAAVGFQVRHFANTKALADACRERLPGALVLDMLFAEGEFADAHALEEIRAVNGSLPPVVVLSERDDMEARLAAHRAGAARYFRKPLDFQKLCQTLNGLTDRTAVTSYRVLVLENDHELGQYYCTLLQQAGIAARHLANPLRCLEELESYQPDLLLVDVHMQGCSGPEVVAVIRQDDTWAQLPVVFLSTETDRDKQLAAIQEGGDDFLLKPIEPAKLLESLMVRLKRARHLRRLNEELRLALLDTHTLRRAMDQHDIVSITDAKGRITYANERFCQVSGYSQAELLGGDHRMVNSGMHSKGFFKQLWASIGRGEVWHGEVCNRRKDGSYYWVNSTIVPFLNQQGQPYQYVSLRTDITALKENEDRLKRSQNFANIGTWDWNIQSGDLYWSERIGPLFGYHREVPETTYDNFLAAIHPDDRQSVEGAVSACVEQGINYDIEHRVVWPDGTVHWLQESGDVVRDRNGTPVHMLGVVQDITKRKEAEWALTEAKEEAENANRAKSQFLSSMSHELRTPMNAILGFAQLLELEELSAEQRDGVEEIMRAGNHLLALINEVLDLARIEAGRVNLSIEGVNLAQVLNECRSLMEPLLHKHNVTLHCEPLPREPLYVRADFMRLKQIMLNLLSNACKYNRHGGSVSVYMDLVGHERVRINVKDSGPGISVERQGELFQPFSRLVDDKSGIEGTGIGLVITKQLIELMGGNIGVISQAGEGANFWVEIPYDVDQEPDDLVMGDTAEDRQVRQTHTSHTVLYVEDNPTNIRLVSRLLGLRSHIKLLTAHEPVLGLELAEARRPELILLDINMPGMDGYQLLAKLRASAAGKGVPILAVSANAMPKDIERGLKAGFDAYLTKPIDVPKFLAAVDEYLGL